MINTVTDFQSSFQHQYSALNFQHSFARDEKSDTDYYGWLGTWTGSCG